MITSTRCFEAHCDECARGFGGYYDDAEDGESVHYDSREALERSLGRGEWAVTGERILCPECQSAAACGLIGHQWEDWAPFNVDAYKGRRRECAHCTRPEYDPPIPPVPDLFTDNT
ncbi:hypothetical protein [Mycolicibacterium llatzerense]|uniref:hypothetical protein n=1 Tax=Mycolicibacterium llatzerense TaxID=280871 RepID=UPI0021B64934|nr:hypothetical protein [Mycolicibacterium llatzerense]MCT7371943.1 hypothetical protein [Mycolicibacterium llatzerense]